MSSAPAATAPRRICFVTGTRAEFGLMGSTLHAIQNHRNLSLQLVVTGMHLDRARGRSLDQVREEGWKVDAIVPWLQRDSSQTATAAVTGKAMAALADTFARLQSDIVLVTGDRVEVFAAAAAAHISGKLVAHVHGGDRALGLIDDSLRHATTKLAHVHFPATVTSADRIRQLGEEPWRILRVGSPGIDDVRTSAAPRVQIEKQFPGLKSRRFAIVLLHPEFPDERQEGQTAERLLKGVRSAGFEQVVIVHPNNDPGSQGIARYWDSLQPGDGLFIRRNLPRSLFLGLMRDSAALAGNSSSGIIEAASFGTAVLDIGERQAGRERGPNVLHASPTESALRKALKQIWNQGHPLRFPARNLYGTGNAGARIANTLARINPARFQRKLIAY